MKMTFTTRTVKNGKKIDDEAHRQIPDAFNRILGNGFPPDVKIYIDGAYVDTTPLFEHKIAPGGYSIRVVNERTGLDTTATVAVDSGEVTRKTFLP